MIAKKYIILVWGPPLTGKTLNREAMRKHFECDHVLDDPSPYELGVKHSGRVLVLASERLLQVHRQGERPSAFNPDDVYPVDAVEVILDGQWIKPVADYRSPGKSGKECFSELLDKYPRLAGFWDRSGDPRNWECDLERVRATGGVLSNGEHVILNCLIAIWVGGLSADGAELRIDFTDLAGLDPNAREPLLDWLNDPFWP